MKLLVLLCCFSVAALGDTSVSSRIIKGNQAVDAQFPYAVSIRKFWFHFCGGAILNKRWVLTAAHCEVSTPFTSILVGTVSMTSGGQKHAVSSIIVHEEYDNITQRNDIALIEISGEFQFSELVKSVKIKEARENEIHTVLGWGMLDSETEDYPDILQFVDVKVLDLKECQETFRVSARVELIPWDKQVCAFGGDGAGTCGGDSGGPLVTSDGYLVGILAYGPTKPCGEVLPDVFTKASAYVEWIEQTTNDTDVAATKSKH